ncbi:MAG TPA: hypothetical protein VD866_02825 [Urbifossiella sp.]|nr:hypothetical protein [Urbifossiella sp.]
MDVRVVVAAREFRGSANCRQELAELRLFAAQLADLQAGGRTDAVLDSGEGWFFVRLDATDNPRSPVSVDGFVSDGLGDGNTLRFRLTCDRAELPGLAAEAEAVLRSYPLV